MFLVKKWGPQILLVVAAGVLLWQLAVGVYWFLEHDWQAVTFAYPLDYGEGPLLDQTMRLARLENIYRRQVDVPPYTISNYPPLFLLVQVPFAWFFGPAFWYGRAISALSVLAAAVLIGLTLYALTHDWLASLIGGLMLLIFPYILHWSSFNRVDSLALATSCGGLFLIVRWGERRRGLVGAAILMTAAIYTRQSFALAAPFAAFVWLLRQAPRRRAFELAAWVGGLCLALFLGLNLITQGGFFFNIVNANVNPFYWDTVQRYAEEIGEHLPGLLIACGVFGLAGAWFRPRSWWLVAPYLLGATLSALTIGKSGSSVNYLFEFCAALSLVVGALIAWWGKRWWLRVILILLLVPQVAGVIGWARDNHYHWAMHKIEMETQIERLAQIVHQAEGPVLADEYMGLIPLDGRRLYFQPFELKKLYEAGLWDHWSFVEAIQRQEFGAILLYEPPYWNSRKERWTNAALAAIEMYYQRGEKLADTVVYRPRK